MSANYNTRRSGGFGGQQQNVGNIGQRRPVVTNNFVPGGQLSNQQKTGQQPQQQQRGPQQQQPGINFRNQQQQNYNQQQKPPQQQQQQQQKPQQPPQQQQQKPLQQQPPQQQQQPKPAQQQPPVQQQQARPAAPVQQQQPPPAAAIKQEPPVTPGKPLVAGSNPMPPEPMETGAEQPKPKRWNKTGNKITKKEKLRRRNLRLSRMLQPKNAVMILNELIKNPVYNVEEIPVKVDPNQYKATVSFDDQSHVGLGRSKNAAKNSAAESALKYLVKHKQLQLTVREGVEGGGDEQMDVTQENVETATAESILPWQHVASFALFKLFSSWGEDPALTTRDLLSTYFPDLPSSPQAQELLGCPKASAALTRQQENRPSKKMPPNPDSMNPLMLINQMLPHAQFEEVGKSGNPPNVTFSFSCNVDGEKFMGTGPNKKAAKRQAAFGACHKILGVTYPSDVYVPIY